MREMSDREVAKRRIMFVAGEDFYFLAYTLFILLAELKATTPEKALVDPRKLSYLADFLGADSDLRLAITSAQLSVSARSRLSLLYDRAVARRATVERLLEALTRRGLISLTRNSGKADHVHLLQTDPIKTLLTTSHFDAERQRLQKLREALPRLRSMTLSTLRERLFDDRGVQTWGD